MLLFYVRHGDPIYVPDSLTPLGKRQAEAAAKRLAVYGIDEIYASPSARANDTAVPTSEITKKSITTVDLFNELHAWNYFTETNDAGKKAWIESIPKNREIFVSREMYELNHRWYEHPEFSDPKFKEGAEFYTEKIDEFMLSLGYEHNREANTYRAIEKNNKRIAIFAHAGIGGVFLSSILGIPYPQFVSRFNISHTGITVIDFDECGENIIPTVLQFDNDSHLYKEGLPTIHDNRIPI